MNIMRSPRVTHHTLSEQKMNSALRFSYCDFCLIAILFFGSIWLQSHVFFNWDASWHLEGAKRMLARQSYSRGIFDDNLPMVFWFYVPVVLAHHVFDLNLIILSILFVHVIVLMNFVFCNSALKIIYINSQHWKLRVIQYGILIFLLFFPGEEFGQRDMLVMSFLLPWITLTAARLISPRTAINKTLAIFVGLLAAIGIAMNPFYMLIVLTLLMISMFKDKRFLMHAEQVAFFIALFIYFVLIYFFYPDYYTTIIPSYLVFSPHYNARAITLFQNYSSVLVLFSVFVFCLTVLNPSTRFYWLLIVWLCIMASEVVYFVNGKSWLSHLIFVINFANLFFLAALCEAIAYFKKAVMINLMIAAIALYCLFLSGLQCFLTESAYYRLYQNPKSNINQFIAFFNKHPHSSLYVFSPNLITTFTFLHYTSIDFLPPWPNCWMIPAMQKNNAAESEWKKQWTNKYRKIFFRENRV